MKLTADIRFEDRSWKRRLPDVAELTVPVLKQALKMAGWPAKAEAEVSIVYSNDNKVQALNHDWRGKDRPTNVLSFPQIEDIGDIGPYAHLGDIILAYQTISREAKEQGKAFQAHLTHLLVHGLLHLLGHDHMTGREAEKMEKLEVQIMAKLGYADPYKEIS